MVEVLWALSARAASREAAAEQFSIEQGAQTHRRQAPHSKSKRQEVAASGPPTAALLRFQRLLLPMRYVLLQKVATLLSTARNYQATAVLCCGNFAVLTGYRNNHAERPHESTLQLCGPFYLCMP